MTEATAAGTTAEEVVELPDDIISDDDDLDLGIFERVEEPEPVSAAPTETAVTSAAQTAAPAQVTSVAVSTVPATITSAATVATEALSSAPAISTTTEADPVKAFTAWRGNAEKLLAENHYALSQETLDEIQENPAVALPKLMARVYLDAVTASTNVLIQNLPAILDSTLGYRDNAKKLEDQFDGEWPGLKDHRAKVVQIGQVYRQLNPKATAEEFSRDVGAQAAFALGLTVEAARGKPVTSVQQPQRPAISPHRPPAAAARPVGAPAPTGNQFTDLAMDTDY